jgi:hypothetical protein
MTGMRSIGSGGEGPCCLMRYQLILQFTATTMSDFDQLVALEKKLVEELDSIAVVDGHDFGQSEFNIFIFTEQPTMAFERAHQIVRHQVQECMRAVYRESTGEDYVILWPSTLRGSAIL